MNSRILYKNLIANSLNQGLKIGFPVLIQFYIIRHLRLVDIGFWNIILSAKTIVLMSITFFNVYLLKETASATRHSEKKYIISNSIAAMYITLILPLCIFLIYMLLEYKDQQIYVLITACSILTMPLSVEFYFQAEMKNDYLFYRQLVTRVLFIILLFLLVKDENDFLIYAIIVISTSIFENFINFYLVRKSISITQLRWRMIKKIIKRSISYFPFRISYNILPSLSIIIGAYYFDINKLAIFSILIKLINLLTTFITSAIMVLFPMKVKAEKNAVGTFNDNKYLTYTLLLSFLTVLVLIFCKNLVFFIFLEDNFFPGLSVAFSILSAYIILHSTYNYFIYNYYLYHNQVMVSAVFNVLIILLYVVLSYIFNEFNLNYPFSLSIVIPVLIVTGFVWLYYKNKRINIIKN